ncbi:hypothetical protein R3P38DRAFT_2832230 [Favolaschia claudopus]|uniref:CCD97-like C-terminal domain-containing protein n=1 Tax=Favolaschia claudopus TaxID=2862362 RepID=A0AAW0EAE3_9AGAR
MPDETSVMNDTPVLSYLGLDPNYQPHPKTKPYDFLALHLRELPPNLLLSTFASVVSPKERSRIPTIRNRRLKYANTDPQELRFSNARDTWPLLYDGQERRRQPEGDDEREWAAKEFLKDLPKHVGKLGALLGGYEDEREAERFRAIRRARAEAEFVPEEESESDEDEDEDEEHDSRQPNTEQMTDEDAKASFTRLVREHFIYGLLEDMDYDKVDWDENLDSDDDRDAEERWFDEEEED